MTTGKQMTIATAEILLGNSEQILRDAVESTVNKIESTLGLEVREIRIEIRNPARKHLVDVQITTNFGKA